MLLRSLENRIFGRLPDFICVGAQKAGTTWLHRQLSEHPEIFVPETKELDFFIRDRSVLWYRRQFRYARADQILGDLSPNYMPQVDSESIVHLIPGVKVICMLRDPANRAFSQWKMARFRGSIPKSISFMDAFSRDLRFMKTRGHYSRLIRRLENHFPFGTRLAVFFFEDITLRPLNLLQEIFSYLGVSESFVPNEVSSIVGPSPTSEVLSPPDRQQVIEHYRKDISELEQRFDRDLSAWKM